MVLGCCLDGGEHFLGGFLGKEKEGSFSFGVSWNSKLFYLI